MNDAMSRHDEQKIGTLIRRAGPRMQPDAAARDKARAAVHAEWRAVAAERGAKRRRTVTWAMAAGVAAAGFAVWMSLPLMQTSAAPVAVIALAKGLVETGGADAEQPWRPAVADGGLSAGSELRTGAASRVALRFGNDLSVRVDENSIVAVAAADRIVLRQGAVYVDAGDEPNRAAPLLVETPFGVVRHLGTQYEARTVDGSVRLRVREGRVAVSTARRTHEGNAGEQLTIGADGAERRAKIGRAGEAWAWVSDVAPAYDIENRSLAGFLRWVGRETGRDVVYASRRSEDEAHVIMLRGSVAGLRPEQALAAVLNTTQLSATQTPETLLIDFRVGNGQRE